MNFAPGVADGNVLSDRNSVVVRRVGRYQGAVVRQFIKGTSVAAMITLSTLEGGHKRAKSPKSRLPLDTVLHRRRLWRELREVGMHALTGFRLRDRIDGADRRFWGEKPRARSRVRW